MNHKGISVVIPNYNGAPLLPEILPSLYLALQKSRLPFEVIISDDCSTDDSVTFVQTHYPEIQLIQNSRNKGFSPTINAGIRKASYDWVLLLNSDVKLEEDYFLFILRYMDDDNCFGVMGRIIGWDDNRVQDGGKYPSYHGFKIKTNLNYLPTNYQPANDWYSMYLSGANAFVNREKLMMLDGFDELFAPFYVEDFELSLRAWRMGWSCHYEHDAICRHRTSITIKNTRSKRFIKTIYNRNKFFLHALHLDGMNYFFWWGQLIFELIFRLISGQFYFIKSFTDFIGQLKEVRCSRKKLVALASKENKRLLSVKQVSSKIESALAKKTLRII